jgi:hypothetical protein
MASTVCKEDLGTLKQHLAELGVNGRGWRLFLNHGYGMFRPLGERWCDLGCQDPRGDNEVAWLKILQACEMDVLPPEELVRSIRDWQLPGRDLEVIPHTFLRAAWQACVAASYDEEAPGFVQNELVPMAQWYFLSGAFRRIQPGQLKAGWSNLKRLRRESVDIESRKLGPDDWPPVVRRFETGAYRMTALSYAHQLREEGIAMRHCVGDYVERCRTQPIRIFSVVNRKTGARVATLSLVEQQPGVWSLDQLKGPGNADVDAHVWREADALLQVMNQVSRDDAKVRQFLDFIHSLGVELDEELEVF